MDFKDCRKFSPRAQLLAANRLSSSDLRSTCRQGLVSALVVLFTRTILRTRAEIVKFSQNMEFHPIHVELSASRNGRWPDLVFQPDWPSLSWPLHEVAPRDPGVGFAAVGASSVTISTTRLVVDLHSQHAPTTSTIHSPARPPQARCSGPYSPACKASCRLPFAPSDTPRPSPPDSRSRMRVKPLPVRPCASRRLLLFCSFATIIAA
jgi:hypothetical protein